MIIAKALRWYDFSKGARYDKPEHLLEEGEVPHINNFILKEDQKLWVRKGLARHIPSFFSSPVKGLYRTSVGSQIPYLLVVAGGTVYKVSDYSPSWNPVLSGLFDANDFYFDTYLDKVFFTNGANYLYVWDGETAVPVTEAHPGCQFVQHYADRLFIASSYDNPDTLFYSELFDYQKWEDPETEITNLINVSPGDDERITGIIRTQDHLTIFKTKGIFYLRGYDPEEWILQRVTDDLGCIAPRSIVQMDGRTIWLSNRGVYMDDGEYFYQIGAAIQPVLQEISPERLAKAFAFSRSWYYYLFVPVEDGTEVFVYNVRTESWFRWFFSGKTFSVGVPANLPRDERTWFVGSATNSLVYEGEVENGTDDGVPYTAALRLPMIGNFSKEANYDLRRVALDYSGEAVPSVSVTYHLKPSFATTVDRTVPGSGEAGEGGGVISLPPRPVPAISIQIQTPGDENWHLNGVAAEVRIKRSVWRR